MVYLLGELRAKANEVRRELTEGSSEVLRLRQQIEVAENTIRLCQRRIRDYQAKHPSLMDRLRRLEADIIRYEEQEKRERAAARERLHRELGFPGPRR